MRLLWIVANYDQPGDGVGKFTARIVDELRRQRPGWSIRVATADTISLGRLRRFFSGRMARCLLRTAATVRHSAPTAVIVEYPFLEQSPLILPAMRFLQSDCRKQGTKLILSLHEYLRVSPLRAWSVRQLGGLADGILVTDSTTRRTLASRISVPLFLRSIPSSIPQAPQLNLAARARLGFCFFGVVNRSKAFREMLQGWALAYRPGMALHLISANIPSIEAPGLVVHHSPSDEQVAEILAHNTFLVLPILPSVGPQNTTLKAGLLNGLIPIGVPSLEFPEIEPLFMSLNDYRPESFAKAFSEARTASAEFLQSKALMVRAVQPRWSVSSTVGEILLAFRELQLAKA